MVDAAAKDFATQPLPFMLVWGVPLVLLFGMDFLSHLISTTALVLTTSVLFAWMGAGCVVNAWRCGRLHCYISGPALLLGSAGVLLTGFRVVRIGPAAPNYIVWTVFAVVILSFAVEWIKGTYANRDA